MKFKLIQLLKIGILLLIIQLPSRGLAQKKDYVIDVNLSSLKYFPACIYKEYSGGGFDSLNVKSGRFKLTGKVDSLTKVTLVLFRKNPYYLEYRTLYISPGKITIKGDSSLKTARVTTTFAGKEQVLYDTFKTTINNPMNASMQHYTEAYNLAEKEGRKKSVLDSLKKKYWETDSLQKQAISKFIKEHLNSIVALDLYVESLSLYPDLDDLQSTFARFAPEVRHTARGKELEDRIANMKKSSIHEPAQNFTQPDTNGVAVSLKDFRGKYVLIDFWASWCGPCRVENPNLVKVYQKYKDMNFTVLGVSLDNKSTETAWKKAIHADGLTWTHVSDLQGWKSPVAHLYSVTSIPQNFLVNPEGIIVAKGLRGEDLERELKKLLTK